MTGRGNGMCSLKLPHKPKAPITGVAGRTRWPIGQPPDCETELTQLCNHAQYIELVLAGIHKRIERLEASRLQKSDGA